MGGAGGQGGLGSDEADDQGQQGGHDDARRGAEQLPAAGRLAGAPPERLGGVGAIVRDRVRCKNLSPHRRPLFLASGSIWKSGAIRSLRCISHAR